MPPAPHPADEMKRLEALRASGLLDIGRNPDLETIVREAAALYDTPIAAVTLLTATHQHFAASVGLGVPYTTRDEAFCGYAILQTEPLIVLDAHADARFKDNPLVLSQPGIRFYVGVPIFDGNHQPFGALCVIDTKQRLGVEQAMLESLQLLAGQVTSILARPRNFPERPFR
jgi:GAF domain-containing protein